MNTTIAQRVFQRLGSSSLSQKALGDLIGLDATKMSKARNGSRAFSTGELAAISDALKVDIYWLINGEPSDLSPRYAYRHTFDEYAGAHSKPCDALEQQIERTVLAYTQAGLERDDRLEQFRALVGGDRFNLGNLPTGFQDVRPAARAVQMKWKEWLSRGKDPVRDIESFLWEHFGVELVVADVAGQHRVNTQVVQVAGASVIVVERSGTWYSTLFGIFHELAHLIFGALGWRGEGADSDDSAFEPFANGFAGDVLLSRDDLTSTPRIAEMPLEELADFLWAHAVGLETARIRCAINRVDGPSADIAQGDITLQWRDAHGDERMNIWGAPSYPRRLVDRHEELVRSGDAGPDVLAWMLGVPAEELVVKREPTPLDEDTRALLEQLGIPA
ncbi:MAG: ImmA/IrrE family metallo-endopeptidase [Brachybacterium tyrofermentans]